jgi:hypothetical protein
MKFLQMPKLAELTSFLSSLEIGDQILNGVVEAYSCKATGYEKKMTRQLDLKYETSASNRRDLLSSDSHVVKHNGKKRKAEESFALNMELAEDFVSFPKEAYRTRSISFSQCGSNTIPGEELAVSGAKLAPLGSMTDPTVRARLVHLIGTMNATFHDYDFSCLKPDRFVRHSSYKDVMPVINKNFAELVGQQESSNGFLKVLWDALDKAVVVQDCEVFSYLADDNDPAAIVGNLWSLNYFFYNDHLNRIVYFTCVACSKFCSNSDSSMVDYEVASEGGSFDGEGNSEFGDRNICRSQLLREEEDDVSSEF